MTEKEAKEQKYEAVEVPVQYAPAIRSPKGEIMTTELVMAEILNVLEEIKKKL